jgi:hypothetical protein
MIKLTTALLALGVGMAIATTTIAQPGWWVGCNPDAPACRVLDGGADPQWTPGYVAPTRHRSLYMYAPRHGSNTHVHRTHTNGGY